MSGLDEWLTIPVDAGIARVTGDGTGHDLTGGRVREVEIDEAGTIWVAQGRRVIALGKPGAIEPRALGWQAFPRRLSVTQEGELLAAEDGGAVVALDGLSWSDRSDELVSVAGSLHALDGGSAWRAVRSPDGPNRLASMTPDGWLVHDAADVKTFLEGRGSEYTFARTLDDRVWLGVDQGHRGGGLAVFDGHTWSEVLSLGPIVAPRVLNLAAGHDGTLWALLDLDTRTGRAATSSYMLARLDDDEWTVYSAVDGLPQDRSGIRVDGQPVLPTPMVVGLDGTVWFSIERVGLVSFDGTRFTRVDAPGVRLGALDLALDPDGSIWVASVRGGLYVMTPEAPTSAPHTVVSRCADLARSLGQG